MEQIKKEKQINKIALKAGILYIIAELITRGISFLTTPVFTRLLPTNVYAEVKLYESWVYLIAPILSISVYQSIPRAKFDFKMKYKKYVSSILFFMLIVTILVIVALLPVLPQISIALDFSVPLILFMIIYCYAYNSIQCIQAHARQMMYYKRNMLLTFMSVVPSVLISVFFVILYREKASSIQMLNIRIFSFFLPTTILGIVLAFCMILKERHVVNYEFWKYAIKYSAPMMIFSLSTQILFQSDKIMVKQLCGIEATAIVALSTTVGYIMDILVHAVDNAWRPWLFEKLNLHEYKSITKVWNQLLLIMGVMTWLMVMLAPELISFLGGERYREAIWLIAPVMCGAFANFVGIGYTAIEQFYKKTQCSGYASAITAIINIILNYIFILKFGYMASAYTTAISYLLAAVIHGSFVKKFEQNDVLNFKNNLKMWGLIFILCIISMYSYNLYFLIRMFITLIIIIILGLKYKKEIGYLMKNLKINSIR